MTIPPRGQRFWDQTTAGYGLSESELLLLTETCRTLDVLDSLDAAVRADGPTTLGSKGQTVVHPAIGEARGQRLTLARLLSVLGVPQSSGCGERTVRRRG